MHTPVQLNIFLLLFGGLQGLLLTILLIRKKTYLSAYRFLIAYILVLILQTLSKVVSKSWLIENVDVLYFSSYQLPFLYGPLVYLLVLHLRFPDRKLSVNDSWHFIPFALSLLATILNLGFSYYLLPLAWLTDVRVALWLHLVSIIGYHYAAYRVQVKLSLEGSMPARTAVLWLRTFVLASAFVSLAIALGLFFLYISFPRLIELRWIFSILTVFIYWITYKAISQPETFAVIRGGAAGGPPVHANMKLTVGREKQRYSSSRLNEDTSIAIRSSLHKLMTSEKLYLDPEISLDGLADTIGCSRHHLSQVINEKEGLSFYEYVNRFRIEEASQQLADPDQRQKIASIAFASGFNSLSAFNEVFKKTMGMTPSDYRKQAAPQRRRQV